MRILVTGGAGFVGSAIARHFHGSGQGHQVVVFDNLRRRGSEWNLDGLMAADISFVHGDVRNASDLEEIDGNFDVLIEASAEPSVLAGVSGSPKYVLDTNVMGAMNCLEFARSRCAGFVFLSSSRVYSIEPLMNLPLVELSTRFDFSDAAHGIAGASEAGIAEGFACDSFRSYYGASKLAGEMLCQEYAQHAGLPVLINRCGVIAGPGQFGKTDQGVFTLWVAHHYFGRALKYTGFGGKGLQVRDLLHPQDLCELIDQQLQCWDHVRGCIYNVGGGRSGSVSLQEFTALCQETLGRSVTIAEEPATSSVDIPWYVTDHRKVSRQLNWAPIRKPREIVENIADWLRANEERLATAIKRETSSLMK